MAAAPQKKKKANRSADRRNLWLLVLTTLLVIGSVFLFTPPAERINQGLDIQGGLSVVLTAKGEDERSANIPTHFPPKRAPRLKVNRH